MRKLQFVTEDREKYSIEFEGRYPIIKNIKSVNVLDICYYGGFWSILVTPKDENYKMLEFQFKWDKYGNQTYRPDRVMYWKSDEEGIVKAKNFKVKIIDL